MITELPESLQPLLESDAMRRLKRIDMNCGLIYTSLPLFRDLLPYSRFDHSVGTASLAFRYTGDPVIAAAALFHDIATPVFSHVVDFMHGDHEIQEFTEGLTAVMIENDPVIQNILSDLSISTDAVSDYHRYPIADNDSPRLSCDRLEYTLQNMVRYGLADQALQQRVIQNLCGGINEAHETELVFHDETIAEQFALAAVSCGKIYSGKEDRYAMEILAGILKEAVRRGVLDENGDLYTDEDTVIQKLMNSPMKAAWSRYKNLHEVRIVPSGSEGAIAVSAKRRYIDPYVKDKGRVSSFSEQFRTQRDRFLEEDYTVFLKGEF